MTSEQLKIEFSESPILQKQEHGYAVDITQNTDEDCLVHTIDPSECKAYRCPEIKGKVYIRLGDHLSPTEALEEAVELQSLKAGLRTGYPKPWISESSSIKICYNCNQIQED